MPDPTDDARAIADSITLDWSDLGQQMKAIFAAIAGASGEDLLTTLGFEGGDPTFDKVAESTLNEAAARAADLVGKRIRPDGEVVDNPDAEYAITESTRSMLFETLNDAFEQGLSAGEIRNQIVDGYSFSARRALNIARTERSFAQQRGALVAAKASGVVKGKRCVLASEHPADDECDDAADDGIIAIEDDFSPGGDPPFHPSCSCTLEFTTEEVPDEPNDEDEEAA